MTSKGCGYIGRSFTGVIITIHLPHPQTLQCVGVGVFTVCKGGRKPSYLGRLRQLCDGGDSWAKFFYGIAKWIHNLLKSFNHRLFSCPKKSEIILWICINLFGSIKNVYYAFFKCFGWSTYSTRKPRGLIRAWCFGGTGSNHHEVKDES